MAWVREELLGISVLRPLEPSLAIVFLSAVLASSTASAEVKPVDVRLDEPRAWVGQRVSFFVELRAAGSFSGSANFDLPQLPGVMVIKIGSPVVGSQQLEGKSWFVQTHEFALFSQRAGTLTVPEFSTRFSRRDDFTGPVNELRAMCPSFNIEIERPPGSEDVAFLITTDSLEVSETWNPAPGTAKVGSVFKRTIVQRAEHLPGMAFAPMSNKVPDGIRVYPGEVATNDQLERGDFLGERSETVTYLLQKPGTFELPELKYVWWNPMNRTLESKTLPAVSFDVTSTSVSEPAGPLTKSRSLFWPLLSLAALVVAIGLAGLLRQRIAFRLRKCWARLYPPEQVAARRLQHACRHHNQAEACAAWWVWRNMQEMDFSPERRLEAAVAGLQRSMFGPSPIASWEGEELSKAFREQIRVMSVNCHPTKNTALPQLNPKS